MLTYQLWNHINLCVYVYRLIILFEILRTYSLSCVTFESCKGLCCPPASLSSETTKQRRVKNATSPHAHRIDDIFMALKIVNEKTIFRSRVNLDSPNKSKAWFPRWKFKLDTRPALPNPLAWAKVLDENLERESWNQESGILISRKTTKV